MRARPVDGPGPPLADVALRPRPPVPGSPGLSPIPMPLVRYLDCALVVLTAPFVLIAGLPLLGYAVAATVWLAQRMIAVFVERKAKEQGPDDLRRAVGINVGGMIVRAWLVTLAIVAVGTAGSEDDGAMAAATILFAFTVYFAMSLFNRPQERKPAHS